MIVKKKYNIKIKLPTLMPSKTIFCHRVMEISVSSHAIPYLHIYLYIYIYDKPQKQMLDGRIWVHKVICPIINYLFLDAVASLVVTVKLTH
jgi:hypothetical protein